MAQIWIILLLINIAFVLNDDQQSKNRCWSSGNGSSARWWENGTRIDRGRYWYECIHGHLRPMGCFTPLNERLELYEKFVQNGYEMQCVLENGYLQFRFTACISEDGKRHGIGEIWEDERNMYWFECKADGPYLKVEIRGCVSHDKTKRIPLNEAYEFGGYVYECQKKYNGTVQMCSVGCVHNGVRYKIGDQWPDGDFIYYCKLNNGRCQKVCVGCQFRNKRLYDGDRYQKDDTVFECEVRPDKYGHKPVGCVVRDERGEAIERILGCRWYQKTKNSKIEQICLLENNKTIVKTLGCVFVYKGYDTLFVYPGTYTIWNQPLNNAPIGVACKESSTGNQPTIETFNVDEIAYKTQGLRYDQPRG